MKKIYTSNKDNDTLDFSIEDDIINKKYDIVIYGSLCKGNPYYNLVCKYYNPTEIILLCGKDEQSAQYNQFVNKGHYVFVREL